MMKKKIVTKLFAGLMTAALVLSVSGCGVSGKTAPAKDVTETEASGKEESAGADAENAGKETKAKADDTGAETTGETVAETAETDDASLFWQDAETVELSYDRNVLTVNGRDFKLDVNEIMNAQQAGNFIVVESHINPHVSAYSLFCLDTCEIEETLVGANLIWTGDDISTAVYSSYNEIYNYRGNCIAVVDDGKEICALSFDETYGSAPEDISQIIVSYWKDDYDTMYTTFCEYEHTNAPLFAYENYLRRPTKERWEKLLSYAPDDAIAFVAEGGYLSDLIVSSAKGSPEADPYSYDQLLVVALTDDTECALRSGTWYWDEANDREGFDFDAPFESDLALQKGEATIFQAVIPEGVPGTALDVRTKTGDQGIWPISMISGYNDEACLFVTRQ